MAEEPEKYNKIIRIFRITLILFGAIFLFWLIDANFAPRGVWQVSYNNLKKSTPFVRFEDPNPFVGYFGANQKINWMLYNDLTKFHLKLPVSFEKMKLTIYYKNREQDLIFFESQSRIGLENRKEILAADFLSEIEWLEIKGEDLNLWQRPGVKQYQRVDDFFANPPEAEKILAVNYDIMPVKLGVDIRDVYTSREEFTLEDYDYILANYEISENNTPDKTAEFEFDLRDLFVNDNNFYFNIYAPGLQKNQGKVEIKKMKITAFKKPFWERF